MFAVETFVGAKHGSWARGSGRYRVKPDAVAAMRVIWNAEHKAGVTPFNRRVVDLAAKH